MHAADQLCPYTHQQGHTCNIGGSRIVTNKDWAACEVVCGQIHGTRHMTHETRETCETWDAHVTHLRRYKVVHHQPCMSRRPCSRPSPSCWSALHSARYVAFVRVCMHTCICVCSCIYPCMHARNPICVQNIGPLRCIALRHACMRIEMHMRHSSVYVFISSNVLAMHLRCMI